VKSHTFAVCVRLSPGSTIGSGKSRTLLISPLLERPAFSFGLSTFAAILCPMRPRVGNEGLDYGSVWACTNRAIIPIEHNAPSPAVLVLWGRGFAGFWVPSGVSALFVPRKDVSFGRGAGHASLAIGIGRGGFRTYGHDTVGANHPHRD
jgi:hypothetical protein